MQKRQLERHQTLRERILETIREAILRGSLKPGERVSEPDLAERFGISRTPIREAFRQPTVAMSQTTRLWQEWGRILTGSSDIEIDPKDKRFSDPAFKENPLHRTAAKSWIAWQHAVDDWVGAVGFDDIDRQRAEFLSKLVTDAFAPTNFLFGNPSALRKAVDSRGQSLVKGFANYLSDLRTNNGMPTQVDKSAFKVGGNLANTPGAVIHRDDIVELIQYQPATETLNTRPILVVPPQINKYYIYDMSPDKSMVKYLTEQGFQVFVVSWRNPTAEHRNWGLDDYVTSLESAIDVTREITGADSVNVVGACAGGITLAVALGYLYFRTHRVMPAILLHMIFNGMSLAVFLALMAGNQ